MPKPIVVIDTNVFIKALLRAPSAGDIYRLFKEKTFRLALSEDILKEIEEVIRRPKFNFPLHKTKRMLEIIKNLAVFTRPKIKSNLCRDTKDNMFIETAIAAKAKYIISTDKDLLEIPSRKLPGLKIICPEEFLKILFKKGSG